MVLNQIHELKSKIDEANINSNVNLASLQKDGEKIFDIIFISENLPHIENEENFTSLSIEHNKSNSRIDYPLGFLVKEQDNELVVSIEYASELFEDIIASQLLAGFELLVNQILNTPSIRTEELKCLTNDQYNQILVDWNKTESLYPVEKTIIEKFEEQVRNNPDQVAVVFEDISLTYKNLNEEVNKLGNFLITNYNTQPDDLIALCLDRSHYTIIAILAVLKSGAAYVPISPEFPDERIKYVIEETKSKVIIANENLRFRIRRITIDLEIIPIEDNALWNDYSKENAAIKARSNNLAYIIYTSGTTGKPKGVMIENKGVVNLITHLLEIYQMPNNQSILLFANYVFDAAMEQIFLSLIGGHKMVVVKNDLWSDHEVFVTLLNKNKVSYIDMTPSFLLEFPIDEIKHLKYVVAGGEAVTNSLIEKINKEKHVFINTYGPTETTITSIVNVNSDTIYIGRPIANTKIYILNNDLQPLPVGSIGELYIGGYGVARGVFESTRTHR